MNPWPVFCPSTSETFNNYADYLKGEHWKLLKERYHKSKLPKKCVCKRSVKLDMHHRSYKRIGHERLTDLHVLCRDCHYELHDRVKNQTGENKKMNNWNMVSKLRKAHKKRTKR